MEAPLFTALHLRYLPVRASLLCASLLHLLSAVASPNSHGELARMGNDGQDPKDHRTDAAGVRRRQSRALCGSGHCEQRPLASACVQVAITMAGDPRSLSRIRTDDWRIREKSLTAPLRVRPLRPAPAVHSDCRWLGSVTWIAASRGHGLKLSAPIPIYITEADGHCEVTPTTVL
jgi:hypothetical protein